MVIVNISMLTVLHDGVSGKLKISADTVLSKFDCDVAQGLVENMVTVPWCTPMVYLVVYPEKLYRPV